MTVQLKEEQDRVQVGINEFIGGRKDAWIEMSLTVRGDPSDLASVASSGPGPEALVALLRFIGRSVE
jgi:hypothetical protein